MECPKCGHVQPDGAEECARCGVVFAKYFEKEILGEARPTQRPVARPVSVARIAFAVLAAVGLAYAAAGYSEYSRWIDFRPPDGSFIVSFPGHPSPSTQLDKRKVLSWKIISYTLEPFIAPRLLYAVIVADYRPIDLEENNPGALGEARFFDSFKYILWRSHAIVTEKGHADNARAGDWRDYNLTTNLGGMSARVHRRGTRLYILLFRSPVIDVAADKELFMSSFVVLDD